jgi:hypothetical protein
MRDQRTAPFAMKSTNFKETLGRKNHGQADGITIAK